MARGHPGGKAQNRRIKEKAMGIRLSKWRTACIIGLTVGAFGGCVTSVNLGGGSGGGSSSSTGSGGGQPLVKADKVDLLLVVDNSRSMADKQEILAATFADLVHGLINPPCIDNDTGQELPPPPNPQEACPPDSKRLHTPVTDMHIGVISTSIGGHGADSCPNMDTTAGDCGTTPNLTNNDKAHLLARTDVCTNQQAPTYDGKGFLVWDPALKHTPPGSTDVAEITSAVSSIVVGLGQIGCGFESQLESWYRFLVDPQPYASISAVNGEATPQGVDSELLAQRASFLRPDSMLVVLTLSDENDCSTKEYGQYYLANVLSDGSPDGFQFPRARAVCETNPNDPCCASCGQQDPPGCAPDPTCTDGNGNTMYLPREEDAVNLRCWDQKRRFGIDLLYPVDRYIQALTEPMIADRDGNLVPNPIFSDLDPNDANTTIRDPGLVISANIAGVPWQDIAQDQSNLALGFKTATELAQTGTWSVILGDPANYVTPTSPYMIESIEPRPGIAPGNPINGGEWTITNHNDLQYACIFPLTMPRDCSSGMYASCDCESPGDNPLCAPNPNDNGNPTLQVAAKAYPALRLLSVVEGLGDQGMLASICPAQVIDPAPPALDYGYRPALRSLHARMAPRL
jgi:hypothetical protein